MRSVTAYAGCLLLVMTVCRFFLPPAEAGGAEAPIWAGREWERIRYEAAGAREGLDHITAAFYGMPEKRVGLVYEQTVDPARDDAPLVRQHGDSFFRYQGAARWGWKFNSFHRAMVRFLTGEGEGRTVYPGVLPSHGLTDRQKRAVWHRSGGLLDSLNVLESEGERIVADFVWPLWHGGERRGWLVLRCVIHADEPGWLYGRTFVAGAPELRLDEVYLRSFGGAAGHRPPGARQWIAGISGDRPAPDTWAPLEKEEYWFVAAYKRGWPPRNERGSTGVFLPEQIHKMQHGRSGGVRLFLPDGAREVSFAIADFRGQRDAPVQVERLREEALRRQRRLREVDWRPDLAREFDRLRREASRLEAAVPADEEPLKSWLRRHNRLRAQYESAGDAKEAQVECGRDLQELRSSLNELWEAGVERLVSEQSKRTER